MNRIDVLAFKFNGFDAEDLAKEIISYSRNSIVLTMDRNGISVLYKTPGVNFIKNIFKFHKTRNPKINSLILPFLFFLDVLLCIRILTGTCLKYRPRICWTDNVYAAVILGILKKFNLCGKLIYLPCDWLVNSAHKSPKSYLANNLLFPLLDYCACKLSHVVLYSDEKLEKARYRFWGKKITRIEKIYSPLNFPGTYIKVSHPERVGNAICFLGDMRLDSGLGIAIKALSDIRKQKDIIIKIIGHKGKNYEYFKKLAMENRVDPYVEFLGYIKTEKLTEAVVDCFCGLNVLTSIDSFSNYAIPGKQMHYLQLLLPIIATENAGSLVPVIKEKALGLIIKPSVEVFREAVLKIHRDQAIYRKNIMDFVNNLKPVPIKELIEI